MIDAVLVQGTLSTILSVLSSLATSAIVSVGVVWLTKTWISERLKNSIKIEYDAKLKHIRRN
jgi:ABC-type bacteriocin/lantibiotic exporter with double-glycine peptidase domain